MIAITGATGAVGKAAVEKLRSMGVEVRAIGRDALRLAPLARQGAQPFVLDMLDLDTLARSFTGVRSVLAMIPNDVRDQEEAVRALVTAVTRAGVGHVVCLSSLGADKPHGVGSINGLRTLERKLFEIDDLNLLILRPTYFMENHLRQIPLIRRGGAMVGLLPPDLSLAQIAARDLGDYAAQALQSCGFSGKSTRELLGHRDISMAEVAKIIGRAIGKTRLHYTAVPSSFFEACMIRQGFSRKQAVATLEMFHAVKTGWLAPNEMRSKENTTATSFETFVATVFLPQYRALRSCNS